MLVMRMTATAPRSVLSITSSWPTAAIRAMAVLIEKVGTYNPMLPKDDAKRVTLVEERITHWIKNGAQPSERVARFLAAAKLGPKGRISRIAQEVGASREGSGTPEGRSRSRQGRC